MPDRTNPMQRREPPRQWVSPDTYKELLASHDRLETALRHMWARDQRSANPFEHDCGWCFTCVSRVRDEARRALMMLPNKAKSLQGDGIAKGEAG